MNADVQSTDLFDADQHRIKDLIDAIPAGLLMVSRAGQIVMTNRVLENQFGYSAEEMAGKPVQILFAARYGGVLPELQVSDTAATPGRRSGITRKDAMGRRKDGTEFPLEIISNTVETAGGRAVIASLSDTSVRTRLESNFKRMVEASPVGKLMVDGNGTIQLVNARLCQLFGYTREELVGRTLETLLPYHHRKHHVALRRAFMEQPGGRAMESGRDLTGLHKDGSELAVEVGLNPLETEDGMAVVAAITDISERKKLERHLRMVNQDLDDFTAVASHDLRAPLQGIADLVEWCAEDISRGSITDASNHLDRIRLRVTRMETLIDDLLEYARAGRASSDSQDISIRALLDEVADFIEVPETFCIRLRSDISHIHAPRTPLETVLRNLLSNAIKHHDRGHGCIDVEVVCTGGRRCSFSVKDDGPGIPAQAQENLFKLFRTGVGRDRERVGVGLAISKRLIESYGGRLEVACNESRRGAVFRFDWPCESIGESSVTAMNSSPELDLSEGNLD